MPDKPAKVLYIIPATGMGGFERLFYNAVNVRGQMPGVCFASIYAYAGDPRNAELRAAGVHLFFEMKVNRWKNILFYHHLALFKILALIRRERIKIFHAQDNFTMLYGLLAKLILGVKLIRTHHGAENDYWAADNLYFRLFGRLVDMNIFVSRSFLNTFAANNRVAPTAIKHRIVYNGVLNPPEAVLDNPGDTDSPGMIMVGNFYGGRDHLFALHLLHRVLKVFPRARLTLVGNPDPASPAAYNKCLRYIEANSLDLSARILSGITDVHPLLREADLFVYESTRDTFGIAVVEAMLHGLPCLVNDLDTFVEISVQGSLCTLFRTGDLDDCEAKAIQILRDLSGSKQRALASIPEVLKRYSMQGYAKNLMQVYQDMAEHG